MWEAHLLRLGVPALSQHAVEAVELDLLWFAQYWPDAFGELLGYLKLVLSQHWPSAGQQFKQHHAIGEHIHLMEGIKEKKNQKHQGANSLKG